MPEPILRVAVPAPLRALFDYLPPRGVVRRRLLPGVRLRVPFGRSERCGVLIELAAESEIEGRRLKRVLAVIDQAPLLANADIDFLRWASRYYQHPIGEVVSNALPVRLRRGEPALALDRAGWRLTAAGAAQDYRSLRRAPRQAALLRMLQRTPQGALPQDQIYLQQGSCRPVLRALQQKGWLAPCRIAPAEAAVRTDDLQQEGPLLNPEQQAALAAVMQRLDGFDAYLLDGVTGSGKTEVYLSLAQKVIALGRQALVLVPEIGLTPQLMRRFRRRLAAPMSVLHSGLSDAERELGWQQARQGLSRLVLGTRSAVFAPLPDLGLIIVDEEHDLSLKQQDGFRFSARDLAVVRAQRHGCPVLLGSATPSLESIRNAREGRYRHLRLMRRAGGAAPPRLDLLDIRSARLEAGVSPPLMSLVTQRLEAGDQVLLFLNRRGYAPVLTCHDCGWVAQCRRCDARMTLHLASQLLWCHHCGAQCPMHRLCPDCGGERLRPLGQGTERLEEALHSCFPGVGIARIDRDSTRRKGSFERLLNAIRNGEYRLLLGTQMLAKGHHFPDVTLVGILDVDQGLYGADYRSAERMAQLIVQVAGRAGRAEKPGRVVIQTRHPEHPLLHKLLRSGFAAFAEEALRERRESELPPYSFQALLRAEAQRQDAPLEFLQQAVQAAASPAEVELWGPVPAPMERRAGRYRTHLLLQAKSRSVLQSFLAGWVPRLPALKSAQRVRWSIDVDPQEMF